MPKQKIIIGDRVLESGELSWDIVKKLAQKLRALGRWDPEVKVWRLDWHALSRLNDFEELVKLAEEYDPDYASELSTILNELKSIEPRIYKDGAVVVLPKGFDPYEVSKAVGAKIRWKTLKFRFGEMKVPVLVLGPKMVDELPEEIRELLEIKGKGIVIAKPISSRRIVVEAPKGAPLTMVEKLRQLGEITYYVEDIDGALRKYSLSIVKERETADSVSIYLPPYALAFIEDIVRPFGYEAVVEFGLRDGKVEGVVKNFTLMAHQKEAYDAWTSNGMKGTIVIPTGGGKTHIALEAIAELKLPTIIFVPNTVLVDQWVKKISRFLGIPKGAVGVLGKGERKIRDITVATYQSGYKNVDVLVDRFHLVVFDEAHHVPAKTFKDVALYLRAPYRMALSATPERRDKNEILLFKLAGNVVYKIDYVELVTRGVVAPVVVRKVTVPLPPDSRKEYVAVLRQLGKARDPIEKRKIINKLIQIARDNPMKLDVIRQIVTRHRGEKMFIFAGSIEFAEKILRKINDIIPAAALTSKTDSSREKAIQQAFQSGKIRALILVKKGEEGLDVGDASVAIIAGGSKQVREFIQRVGRVLRGGEDKLAWVYEIVTRDTVEEKISKARQAEKLVAGLERIIAERYGIKAYEVVHWKPGARLFARLL